CSSDLNTYRIIKSTFFDFKVAISFNSLYTVVISKKIDILTGGKIMELIKTVTNLSEDEAFDFYENVFSALSDKMCLKIINEISKRPNMNLCVCELEIKLELQQSRQFYHLRKFVDANILIP